MAEVGTVTETKQVVKLSYNAMIQEEDTTWRGSDYMAMVSISHVEMLEEAGSLGFVAADVTPVYSKGIDVLLQNMGFIVN